MALEKGITVLVENDAKGRIEINSGVQKASGYDIYNDLQYAENSVKPITDWREITSDEYYLLTPENYKNHTSIVSIHKLPDNIISLLNKLDLGSSIHSNDAHSRISRNKEITEELSTTLDSYLNKYSIKGSAKLHGLVVMPGSLETTSFFWSDQDPTIKEYLGMHLDTSTDFTLPEARYSRNRICINLGEEDRHLLFVNLTVNQICQKLKRKAKVEVTKLDAGNLGEMFFKFFPNYPVLKIRIKPHEFYIAPTDNCLHDGTTLGKMKNDVTISFLGYFKHQIAE